MIKVFSVAEMVAAEKASDAAGNSYDEMMEKAGRAVADAISVRTPIAASQVTILVGPGNNGGDGLVAGRYLAQEGADVTLYLFRSRDTTEDHNYALVKEMDIPVVVSESDARYRILQSRLKKTDILIDALLGTGVTRPIGGDLARLMEQVKSVLEARTHRPRWDRYRRLESVTQVENEQNSFSPVVQVSEHSNEDDAALAGRPYVVAVDCPSGLNCDSGALDPLAIAADLTVTFAGPKRGHFIFPGAASCGELVVADIDISPDLPEVRDVSLELASYSMVRHLLPDRSPEGHKGTFGWVLIAAGSSRYWGAPFLAGCAAYRSGAGLVALAVPSEIRPALASRLPEATYPLITDRSILSARAADSLLATLDQYKAMLVGPGLHDAGEFMERILEKKDSLPPLVIDADGLNLLAERTGWSEKLPANTILTPHPGEMARLMGRRLSEVQQEDRVELARTKASEWNCVVLLKGAFTVIAAPEGRCAILPFANPLLATAGSGDVLSGVIVSLLGQGLAPYEAAVLGGYLHAGAAQLVDMDAGLLASEIADLIPDVRQALLA